ncbi:hypothetical protein [Pseudomonas fragi]|uniref:Uncharacterized protein n=1 Tax=Pseudomonas fragi TaxID=296 RepID=A0A9Q5FN08_PSEFR|nr:hypothetical protein [Pseudomonas fragi]MBM1201896.1 hypothetical protein [Pseudomonas fragi]MBM1206987.1 hypothetical protein [Pseudomonas fragi]NNB48860.1 hypothetical protein [Pseudomonas fragi]
MKKLLPALKDVTKAGSYGNDDPAFFCPEKGKNPENPMFCGAAQKLARTLQYVFVQEQ